MTADEAILIAYYRGLHSGLARHPDGLGLSMMAVGLDFNHANRVCNRPEYAGKVFVAATNSPTSCTLSGEEATLGELRKEFSEDQVSARMLRVDKAYHSKYMDPCAQPYMDSLEECRVLYATSRSSCTWVSSVHGFEMDSSSDQVDDQYWIDNLLNPVLFSTAVEQAARDHGPFDICLEVGPHPALQGPTLQTIKVIDPGDMHYCATLRRGENGVMAFGKCMAFMWQQCGPATIDLNSFQSITCTQSESPCALKNLPQYQWDHESVYWRESRISKNFRNRPLYHELLGSRIEKSDDQIRWRNIICTGEMPWLEGHKFQNSALFPAAGYCVMAVEAAKSGWVKPLQMIELRDLDIARGINVSEQIGIETIFTLYDFDGPSPAKEEPHLSATAKFSLVAGKADGSDPLTKRFSGNLMVYFGNTRSASLPNRNVQSAGLAEVDLDRFHVSMSNIGLDYSGHFRQLHGPRRRLNQASAKISAHSESFNIHPGFLDSCFQALFVAFAAPGDEYDFHPLLHSPFFSPVRTHELTHQ